MATKAPIDQEAIVKMFSEATARGGDALRKAVGDATLKALQGRELTLDNIRQVLKAVTSAASTGAARNAAPAVDVEEMLTTAVSGMDAALLQAVEANRRALQQFVDQGVGLQAKPLQDALAGIEQMEDTFFAAVSKAAQGADGALKGPWEHVLAAMKTQGTQTGTQATQTVEQLMAQTQAALRGSRTATVKAAQAMIDGYAALASGVLIGMSEGLQSAGADTSGAAKGRKK